MGIFGRVKTIVQSDIHNFLDKVEDPVSMVKHYIRELEEQLDAAQGALSQQLLVERKHASLIEQTEAIVSKRSAQAELAVDRGEDHIAQIALREKLIHQERLAFYRSQYESIQLQTSQLTDQINQLKATYDTMQAKKHYLIARVNAAEAMQGVSTTLNNFDAGKVARGFARIEEKVWKLEADVSASRQMQAILHPAGAYGSQDPLKDSVALELEALKQRRAAKV
ncbi:phage shock protein A [Paenibacillus phyllosphaerae]|uniref:Phage shock protein A n=1 Tax=Paenibacillus phyllosphaerae TaxID=274593 RepID=A0A7W5FQV2_9BACL|nr:PspA/IM30 family protein [Paenibacillus phyllosphaerae]MBB3113846.1 phage shock protein A [Paenibacillus phyllosphaerae]